MAGHVHEGGALTSLFYGGTLGTATVLLSDVTDILHAVIKAVLVALFVATAHALWYRHVIRKYISNTIPPPPMMGPSGPTGHSLLPKKDPPS